MWSRVEEGIRQRGVDISFEAIKVAAHVIIERAFRVDRPGLC